MPSPNFSNAADSYNAAPSRMSQLNQARSNFADGTGKAAEKFGSTPKHLALSGKSFNSSFNLLTVIILSPLLLLLLYVHVIYIDR